MGRPGLTQHRKFRRLVHTLGNAPLARGCLELLWDTAYESGEPYLGDSFDVETAARWTGNPGELTRALLEAGGPGKLGFIEELADHPGQFQIHDLFDHAPSYVQKRMERETARNARGLTISDMRRAAACQMHEKRKQTKASGIHLHTDVEQTGALPLPHPLPHP